MQKTSLKYIGDYFFVCEKNRGKKMLGEILEVGKQRGKRKIVLVFNIRTN